MAKKLVQEEITEANLNFRSIRDGVGKHQLEITLNPLRFTITPEEASIIFNYYNKELIKSRGYGIPINTNNLEMNNGSQTN